MLDLLLDALGALLGLDGGGEEAPSTARQRRSQQPQSSQRPQATSLEDMLRKMMGVEEAETPAPAPKPQARVAPTPRRTNSVRKTAAPAQRSVQPAPAPEPVQNRPALAPAFATASPAPGESSSAPVRDFLDALRTNPDAARQAFVYSEIFGAPLADRQKETLW